MTAHTTRKRYLARARISARVEEADVQAAALSAGQLQPDRNIEMMPRRGVRSRSAPVSTPATVSSASLPANDRIATVVVKVGLLRVALQIPCERCECAPGAEIHGCRGTGFQTASVRAMRTNMQ